MQSITRQVTYLQDETDELTSGYLVNGHSASVYDLDSLNPRKENYTVTYWLDDEEGDYHVQSHSAYNGMAVHFTVPTADGGWGKRWAPVCWLPKEWEGRTVSRRVL